MTRTTQLQNTFSSGEISPRLHARIDFQRFQSGVRSANGFLPTRQGGLMRAPGTVHWDFTRDDAPCRLIAFEFNREDCVLLEFYPGIMRVRRYGELVMDGETPFELVTPYDAAALERITWIQSADVIYLADGELPIHRLARFALDNWSIAPLDIESGPFRPVNTDEAHTVLASGETGTVTLTANFDLFVAGHVGSLFALEPVNFPDIPYWTQDTAGTAGTTRMRHDGRIYLLTAGTNTGVTPPLHRSGIEKVDAKTGATWEYLSDNRGVMRITAVASPTQATATVIRRIPVNHDGTAPAPQATYRWAEGAWSDVYGYPTHLTLYDQRFVAAATRSEPRAIWLSAAGGGYRDFAEGERPDDAFGVIIDGDGSLNKIQWLSPGRRALHIGALAEEYSLRSDSANTIVAATAARIGMDGRIGSIASAPVAPEGEPIFIARDRTRLFQIAYVIEYDANVAREISLPSDHLGAQRFDQVVWQGAPFSMAWVRRGNGDLACMLLDKSEDVQGWARLSLAEGFVEDMAVTRTSDTDTDILVMVVRRTLGDVTRRHIEALSVPKGLAISSGDVSPTHLLCASVVADDTPMASLSVPHLAGRIVSVWTEFGDIGPQSVADDGTLILPAPVQYAEVGLFDETHHFETLDLQPQAQDGLTLGRKKKAASISAIGVYETQQGFVQLVARDFAKPPRYGRPIQLIPAQVAGAVQEYHTGLAEVDATSGPARDISLRFTPYAGAAMTISAIAVNLEEMGA